MVAVITHVSLLFFPTHHSPYASQIPENSYSEPNFRDNLLRFWGPRAGILVGIRELLLLCILFSVCSYVVALWGFRLTAVMGTASPLQCVSLTSSGSQFVELSCSRRSGTLSPNVSSSSSTCFGVRTRLRCGGFELPSVSSRSPRSHRRPTVVASTGPFKQGAWRVWAEVGIPMIVGTFLLDSSARAESIAEACEEIAGGNLNNFIVVACIAQAIALTGAAVGGVTARQRKNELEKINAQLRQINVNLRKQSRVESYAPSLTYAPVGSSRGSVLPTRTEPIRDELMQYLKGGKRMLREHNPAAAFVEFEKALPLARQLDDPVEEKKAVRGLGASCQRQGKYKDAIKYHSLVLSISQRTKEHSGNTEAYGAIADCYTELGDLESAGKFYDQYIGRLENDEVD